MAAEHIHHVLVVDDDERILAAFARTSTPGLRISTARTRAEARVVVERERPDLAVVDQRLGSECGIELVRDLHTNHRMLRIVMFSGYLSTDATVAACHAGAELVLFKPVTLATILQRLEPHARREVAVEIPTLARVEWEYISRVIVDCNGNLSMAARQLGIYRSSLQRRLKKEVPMR
ncbi:MAG: response regulator [Kofleriaceae bacterium]